MLLATNKRYQSRLVKEVIEHLKYTASKSEELSELLRINPQNNKEIEIIKKKIENSKSLVFKELENSGLYRDNRDFKGIINDCIQKITDSIIESYINPKSNKALNSQFIKAIKEGRIEFVSGDVPRNRGDIHAEMKLTQRLLEDKKITRTSKDKFYMGISKRCCANCEAVIKAVNKVIGDKIEESIEVREEGHRQIFPSGIPKFIDFKGENDKSDYLSDDDRRAIRNAFFKEIRDSEGSLTRAFGRKNIGDSSAQLHTRSSSPPDKLADLINKAVRLKAEAFSHAKEQISSSSQASAQSSSSSASSMTQHKRKTSSDYREIDLTEDRSQNQSSSQSLASSVSSSSAHTNQEVAKRRRLDTDKQSQNNSETSASLIQQVLAAKSNDVVRSVTYSSSPSKSNSKNSPSRQN